LKQSSRYFLFAYRKPTVDESRCDGGIELTVEERQVPTLIALRFREDGNAVNQGGTAMNSSLAVMQPGTVFSLKKNLGGVFNGKIFAAEY
jgi:hypothetical protein